MKILKNIIGLACLVYVVAHYLTPSSSVTSAAAGDAPAEQSEAAPVVETISIDAAEFSKKMEDNEVAAMADVEGKKVYVHGTIKRFNLDIGDDPVIELSDGQRYSFNGVSVEMSDKAAVAKLHKGQRIVLSGDEPSEIMGSLYLHNGKIE